MLGSKYGNNMGSFCLLNHSHRSKLESSVCGTLQMRMKVGEFESLLTERHILVCGEPGHECSSKQKIEYIADFECTRSDGSIFYVEAKGFESPVWKLKLRLWRHHRPEKLEIWGGHYARPSLLEEVNG